MIGTPISRRRALVSSAAALAVLPGLPLGAQEMHHIRTGGVPEESVIAALWAKQSGIFRHYGLDVDIESQRSGSVVAAAVAGGSYQIGKSSMIALIVAHSKNIPFVLIAPAGMYIAAHPHIDMLVRADSPYQKASDLNGKVVAVSSLNDLYTVSTKAWVDDHGGDSSTLKLVEIPNDSVGPALATGRIDAAGVATPQLQQDRDAGGVRSIGHPYDAIAPVFTFGAWFTTRDYLAKNRDICTGFARAIRDASEYVNAHQQQTIDPLAKFTGIDIQTIARMPRARMGTSMDPKLFQPTIDACARYKLIPASFKAEEFIERLI
jgi:NitT/TauT family transport system substrate-binding protein